MAKRNSSNVNIAGSAGQRIITGRFAISLDGRFLPIQLIYGGKTVQSVPKNIFPNGFLLSANPKHYSNEHESIKLIQEVIIPYMEDKRKSESLPADQMGLATMDVFIRQITSAVKDLLDSNYNSISNIPPNMTKYYQPLDLHCERGMHPCEKVKFSSN